jgi:ABC-type transporter MlaC component
MPVGGVPGFSPPFTGCPLRVEKFDWRSSTLGNYSVYQILFEGLSLTQMF